MNNKIYIGLITSAGNSKYLEWYNEASKFVDGLAVTWHGERDEGFYILEKNKGCGFIVEREFYQHHAHSMNDWLLNPKIRPGSWIIVRDTMEQCNIEFLKKIREFTNELEKQNVNTVYQYSKLLLFKKFEHQHFSFSPHWGFVNAQPHAISIENFPGFEDPKKYAFSIRNENRPEHHFIDHFVKYYLYDSSNHLLLGREKDHEDFEKHEQARYKFKEHVENDLKIPLTVEALKDFILKNELKYVTKWFFNFEPILNSFYCFHKLGHAIEAIKDRLNKKVNFNIP